MEFEEREGRRTLRLSEQDAVFVDDHKSWYAVHWTSDLDFYDFLYFCSDIGFSRKTPALLLSRKEVSRTDLDRIRRTRYESALQSIDFLRLDARDFVLIWESGIEDRHLIREQRDISYTALIGFGSDRFDPGFGRTLLEMTATKQIRRSSDSVWDSLRFLANSFKEGRIDPHRSYNDA